MKYQPIPRSKLGSLIHQELQWGGRLERLEKRKGMWFGLIKPLMLGEEELADHVWVILSRAKLRGAGIRPPCDVKFRGRVATYRKGYGRNAKVQHKVDEVRDWELVGEAPECFDCGADDRDEYAN